MPSAPETFETYRPLLFSIAYRMLGSAMDAEDMVQEAYLRFERATNVESAKPYLTTIITRLCLDHLKSASTQREEYVGTWLPEPILTGESPGAIADKHESISMAFLVLLENLTPVERAILLLRDVFDYSYAEIATMVDKSEANCRRYYSRAKQFLVEHRSRFEPSSEEQTKLVEAFMQAISTGNIDGLKEMLAEEAVFYGDGGGKAPAVKEPLMGREAVVRFLIRGIYRLLPANVQIKIVEINGAPSALVWWQDMLYFAMHLTITDGKIETIRNILNPDKLSYIRRQLR